MLEEVQAGLASSQKPQESQQKATMSSPAQSPAPLLTLSRLYSDEDAWEGEFNALGIKSFDDDADNEDEFWLDWKEQQAIVNKGKIFNQAWVEQMQDKDLVSALVALAYPDRLAR